MAKAPKPSTPAYEVTSGTLHKDNWIGDHVALQLAAQPKPRTIKLTLWNPFYNRDYLNNQVTVNFDGRKVFSEKMQPARSAVIEYDLAAGEELEIEVESSACMLPDPFDPRERGIIVRLTQEAAGA